MTLSTNTLWFEIAFMATLTLPSDTGLLGHFEETNPQMAKSCETVVLSLGTAVLISATLGRMWFFGLLGIVSMALLYIHIWWLPSHGVNGWSGEPKDKYYKLRGWDE